jgi:hypothetical protein
MKIEGKVGLGYGLGGAAAVALVWSCFRIGTAPWLNLLLFIFGGLLGWVAGILATPLDVNERTQFSTYTAAISTFMSGFVVAKLDRLFELFIGKQLPDDVVIGQSLIFGSAFLLGALFTFIGRLYVKNP